MCPKRAFSKDLLLKIKGPANARLTSEIAFFSVLTKKAKEAESSVIEFSGPTRLKIERLESTKGILIFVSTKPSGTFLKF